MRAFKRPRHDELVCACDLLETVSVAEGLADVLALLGLHFLELLFRSTTFFAGGVRGAAGFVEEAGADEEELEATTTAAAAAAGVFLTADLVAATRALFLPWISGLEQ